MLSFSVEKFRAVQSDCHQSPIDNEITTLNFLARDARGEDFPHRSSPFHLFVSLVGEHPFFLARLPLRFVEGLQDDA